MSSDLVIFFMFCLRRYWGQEKKKYVVKRSTVLLLVLAGFSIAVACNSCQNSEAGVKENNLQLEIEAFAKGKGLKNASVGFLVIDPSTGNVVASLNPDMSLSPASTLKLFATATALELFGEYHRFETVVEYDGTLDASGTLTGNIYIRGGGDPVLGSPRFSAHYADFIGKWVAAVQQLGIKRIHGGVVGDDQIFSQNIVPRDRTWEDMANYYGTGGCGLSIFDDVYEVTLKSPAVEGLPTTLVKVEPAIPGLTHQNYVLSSNVTEDRAFIFGAPYVYQRFIEGTIPKAKTEFTIKGAIPDPAWYAAYLLSQRLEESGIVIESAPSAVRIMKLNGTYTSKERKKITSTLSPPLINIVTKTNKISYNLYPEHLVCHIGLRQAGKGDCETGVEAMKAFWVAKGMDSEGLFIADGSGLSRYNMISARHLTFLLTYMLTKSKNAESFIASLPVSGKDGTLQSLCSGTVAQHKIQAKSGSIEKVRAYAGYANTLTNKQLVFAIMVNNYTCSDRDMRDKLEDLLISIVSYNEQ